MPVLHGRAFRLVAGEGVAVDPHQHELATFDDLLPIETAGNAKGVMGLGIDEKDVLAWIVWEEVGDVQHTHGILVLREGRGGGRRFIAKPGHVVMGDLGELVGGRIVVPDLAGARIVAHVLLQGHRAVGGDGQVVEHLSALRSRRAAQ